MKTAKAAALLAMMVLPVLTCTMPAYLESVSLQAFAKMIKYSAGPVSVWYDERSVHFHAWQNTSA